MIPSCLNLDAKQREKLEKWIELLSTRADYEDLVCSSYITYHCYSTGLGDVIYAKSGNKECNLSYNDDGDLM